MTQNQLTEELLVKFLTQVRDSAAFNCPLGKQADAILNLMQDAEESTITHHEKDNDGNPIYLKTRVKYIHIHGWKEYLKALR